MYLRIYRTHDHDLMLLHQTGAVDIGAAAKAAVIAYYKREPLIISTKTQNIPDVSQMPLIVSFTFDIKESDAPGILPWFNGFRRGYRNCLVKNILRHCLDDPGTALFRDDGWKPAVLDENTEIFAVPMPAVKKKKHQELKGSEWVEAVAKEEKKVNPDKKITDLDQRLDHTKPDEKKENAVLDEVSPPGHPPEEDEDLFDAFDEFERLRKGE